MSIENKVSSVHFCLTGGALIDNYYVQGLAFAKLQQSIKITGVKKETFVEQLGEGRVF